MRLLRSSCFKPAWRNHFWKCHCASRLLDRPRTRRLVAFAERSRWLGLLQIADLGVASFKTWSKLTKEEHNEQRKVTSTAKKNGGTLHYMAPEHLNDVNARPSEKSDVYSFAIVLWAIFANKEPYESRHLQTGGVGAGIDPNGPGASPGVGDDGPLPVAEGLPHPRAVGSVRAETSSALLPRQGLLTHALSSSYHIIL